MEFLSNGGREHDQAEHGNTRALLRPLRTHAIPPVLVCHWILLRVDSQRDVANGEEELRRCARVIAALVSLRRATFFSLCRSTSVRAGPGGSKEFFFLRWTA